jgi:pimeloyl-ACP methyl ester carboxylesterase
MNTRVARAKELYALLGDLPGRRRPISCKTISEEEHPAYRLEKLMLDLNGIERVPAYFVRPKSPAPWPAMLYHHAHGGNYPLGKDELTQGRSHLQQPPYAEELARRGVCSLCIDTWCFGERSGRTESETFKEMLWRGRVLWGMMMYDSIRSLDYLVSRADVDAGRIGTLGISMGSTLAWWTAALDERIRACVDICCLTDFDALIEARGLDGHGIYYYVPRLLKRFTTADINALIAPRAHLSLAGNYDRLTPTAGLDRIDAALRKAYRKSGAPGAWKLLRYDVGHQETAAMRAEILRFLDERLIGGH